MKIFFDEDNLNETLFQEMCDNFPQELDELSHATKIESIDAKITKKKRDKVFGNGFVFVSLQVDSDRKTKEEDLDKKTFPFKYQLTIENEYIMKSEFQVDTSKFYK